MTHFTPYALSQDESIALTVTYAYLQKAAELALPVLKEMATKDRSILGTQAYDSYMELTSLLKIKGNLSQRVLEMIERTKSDIHPIQSYLSKNKEDEQSSKIFH